MERRSWADRSGGLRLYVAWVARIGRESASYSVRKHGIDGARRKAEAWLLSRASGRNLGS